MKTVRAKLSNGQVLYESQNVPEPQLKPYYLSVKIAAAAIKPARKEVLQFLSSDDNKRTFPAAHDFCGKIISVGENVSRFAVGDLICGIISPLSNSSACADVCEVHELDIVKIPSARTDTEAVSCIGSAINAYTSLVYQGNISSGSSVLIMSGAKADSLIAIQLALHWGAKVLTTVCGDEEMRFIEKNCPDVAQVIDIGTKNSCLVSAVMEETGSLGVNLIIDDGVQLTSGEDAFDASNVFLKKHDIISCLAVNGRWITSQPNLQLDPPEAMQLYMRNASLSFLNEHAWVSSKSQQGKYLHMMNDIMEKLASGVIRAHVSKTVQFTDSEDVLSKQPDRQIGVTVMFMN